MKKVSLLGTLMLLVVACGRAQDAAAPQAPASEAAPSSVAGSAAVPESEPQTLAEAEALLDKARADLDRLALNEAGSPLEATAGAAAPAPAPPPSPAATRAEEKRADKAAADQAEAPPPKKEASACETACKAFSSLERASNAVCRLDTEGSGKRCERAKQIREDAARRVSSCSCK
jgi:hypothetical protein